MKGSITVEAAFVVPVIIGCIVLMIYLDFFLHDQVAAEAFAYRNIIAAGQRRTAEDEVQKVNPERLLGGADMQGTIVVQGAEMYSIYEGHIEIPLGGRKKLQIYGKESGNYLKPAAFIRTCRAIQGSSDGTKG